MKGRASQRAISERGNPECHGSSPPRGVWLEQRGSQSRDTTSADAERQIKKRIMN